MIDNDRKDYVLVVNSIDLKNNKYIFKKYNMIGNGYRYPNNDTADVNRLINLLRFDELKQNRMIIDIVSCIVPEVTDGTVTAKVLWDTPGIEGHV